jgi:hypothetical protein
LALIRTFAARAPSRSNTIWMWSAASRWRRWTLSATGDCQRAVDESSTQERSSEPPWLRVMRRCSRGCRRSVDRGERRPAIEPRSQAVWGADAVERSGRPHRRGRYARALDEPHAVEDPEHAQVRSESPAPTSTHAERQRRLRRLGKCHRPP